MSKMRVINLVLFVVSAIFGTCMILFILENPRIERIYLNETEYKLRIDDTNGFYLNAFAVPSESIDGLKPVYRSSNPDVAIVKDNRVYPKGVGTCKIYVSIAGIELSCDVEVYPIEVDNIYLTAEYDKITFGETLQINSMIEPKKATFKTLTWKSSDENILTVDENGLVTAKNVEGYADITATAVNGKSKTIRINVQEIIYPTSITLSSSNVNMVVGDTKKVTYEFYPANVNAKITWFSKNEEIATVDENGLITAKNAGNVTIVAKAGETENTLSCYIITLEEHQQNLKNFYEGKITHIFISNSTKIITLGVGDTLQLELNCYPLGETVPFSFIDWEYTTEGVVEVDKNGCLTVVGTGSTGILIYINESLKGVCDIYIS